MVDRAPEEEYESDEIEGEEVEDDEDAAEGTVVAGEEEEDEEEEEEGGTEEDIDNENVIAGEDDEDDDETANSTTNKASNNSNNASQKSDPGKSDVGEQLYKIADAQDSQFVQQSSTMTTAEPTAAASTVVVDHETKKQQPGPFPVAGDPLNLVREKVTSIFKKIQTMDEPLSTVPSYITDLQAKNEDLLRSLHQKVRGPFQTVEKDLHSLNQSISKMLVIAQSISTDMRVFNEDLRLLTLKIPQDIADMPPIWNTSTLTTTTTTATPANTK